MAVVSIQFVKFLPLFASVGPRHACAIILYRPIDYSEAMNRHLTPIHSCTVLITAEISILLTKRRLKVLSHRIRRGTTAGRTVRCI